MRKTLKVLVTLGIFFLAVACNRKDVQQPTNSAPTAESPKSQNQPAETPAKKVFPISDAGKRATKKLFGTYVTPQNSPVQPERFKGYHTGIDYETFPEEKDIQIDIFAVCDGKILRSNFVSGYGGVVVQSCKMNNNDVTVLYGHLNLESIKNKTGQSLKQGDRIGFLGQGDSHDTDGERKHLHLSVHKGASVDLRGYVQDKSELSNWISYTPAAFSSSEEKSGSLVYTESNKISSASSSLALSTAS